MSKNEWDSTGIWPKVYEDSGSANPPDLHSVKSILCSLFIIFISLHRIFINIFLDYSESWFYVLIGLAMSLAISTLFIVLGTVVKCELYKMLPSFTLNLMKS
jgi:hypothetical protein